MTDNDRPTSADTFAEWCVLELMGHRRLAGRVTEQEIAGRGFLRLDVFGLTGDVPTVTQFYSPSSVYCMTPTTEEIARGLGEKSRPEPVSRFDLPAPDPAPQYPRHGDMVEVNLDGCPKCGSYDHAHCDGDRI